MKHRVWVAIAILAMGSGGCRAPEDTATAVQTAPRAGEVAIVDAPKVNEGVCVNSGVPMATPDQMHCFGEIAPTNQEPHAAPGAFAGKAKKGKELFFAGQFGTNGRTCGTCHDAITGTISPEQVEARYQADPNDPLFRAIDSDDGLGTAYNLLRTRATIRVHIPLPDNVRLVDSDAREVILNRAVPTMFNGPALDPLLMADGRETDVATQSSHAVASHFEPLDAPSKADMDAIADFERTLFTSPALAQFAKNGEEPRLPEGTTPAQIRGREFFVSAPLDPALPKKGLCAVCHSGPRLDTMNEFLPLRVAGGGALGVGLGALAQPGDRFFGTLVSRTNGATTRGADAPGNLNPSYTFEVTQADGSKVVLRSPDPGLGLITGKVEDWNSFRITTLWNIKNTAPYFHDNSARTLKEMVRHYTVFFAASTPFTSVPIVLTPQDEDDIVAYLELL